MRLSRRQLKLPYLTTAKKKRQVERTFDINERWPASRIPVSRIGDVCQIETRPRKAGVSGEADLPGIERRETVGQSNLFSGRAGRVGFTGGICVTRLAAPDRLVDFVTMDRDFFGSLDAQSYLVASDLYDDDRNIIIDDNTFVFFP